MKIKRFLSNSLIFSSRRHFSIILPPKELSSKILLNIGDVSKYKRVFTKEEVENFGNIIDDPFLKQGHENAQNSYFKPNIVYGILLSSIFTRMFREAFPGAIYISQDIKFRSPILIGNKIEGKIEVVDINYEKKNVQFKTQLFKPDEDDLLSVDGTALLRIPNLVKSA